MNRLLSWLSRWPLSWMLGVSAALWTGVAGTSLAWNLRQADSMAVAMAAVDGQSAINKDLLYRRWASSHGGVYVPATEATPPNPYLADIPERDITTPSGRSLTLVNPAYMTRQVHELAAQQFGVRGHITSLKPIRPANAAAPWERVALESFERGARHYQDIATEGGTTLLRVMRPMFVEKGCLKCHAKQGYVEGQIRGGISVTIPLADYYSAARTHSGGESAFHVVVWLIGIGALGLVGQATRLRRREKAADREALVASEQRYRDLFQSMTEGFALHEMLWDGDGRPIDYRFLQVNPAFEALTGLSGAAIIGKTAREVIPGLEQDWIDRYGAVARDGMPCRFENHAEALRKHFDVTAFRTGPSQFAVTFSDVTSRKEAEQKIREQAALLDITQDAIAVSRMDGTLLWVNRGFERMVGWRREEAVGLNASRMMFPEGPPASFQALLDRVRSEGGGTGELEFTRRNGQRFTVMTSWTLMRGADGQPKSLLVVASDITEQRELEARVLRSQRLESLGVMASGVAHDLNNVLAPIMMAAPALRERMTDPDDLEFIRTIEASATRGAAVVRQILTFARGITGERGPVDPAKVVRETEYFLRETLPRSIELTVNLAPDLWQVIGDATQIQQVVMNLCVNARDAMPSGGSLRVDATNVSLAHALTDAEPAVAAGSYVSLAVTDTGSGISDEVLTKIFDPFFTTKPTGQGTGLGLSTVLGIASSHGGGVIVRTKVGAGTTFTVLLPAQPHAAAPAVPAGPDAPAKGAGELVLVVDDEGMIRRLVEQGLKRHGYAVVAARNGEEGLALYLEHRSRVAAVLTDYSMPVMDGPAFIAEVRRHDPALPVVLMSGLGETITDETAAAMRVTHVLVKPFSLVDLVRVVSRLLART